MRANGWRGVAAWIFLAWDEDYYPASFMTCMWTDVRARGPRTRKRERVGARVKGRVWRRAEDEGVKVRRPERREISAARETDLRRARTSTAAAAAPSPRSAPTTATGGATVWRAGGRAGADGGRELSCCRWRASRSGSSVAERTTAERAPYRGVRPSSPHDCTPIARNVRVS